MYNVIVQVYSSAYNQITFIRFIRYTVRPRSLAHFHIAARYVKMDKTLIHTATQKKQFQQYHCYLKAILYMHKHIIIK